MSWNRGIFKILSQGNSKFLFEKNLSGGDFYDKSPRKLKSIHQDEIPPGYAPVVKLRKWIIIEFYFDEMRIHMKLNYVFILQMGIRQFVRITQTPNFLNVRWEKRILHADTQMCHKSASVAFFWICKENEIYLNKYERDLPYTTHIKYNSIFSIHRWQYEFLLTCFVVRWYINPIQLLMRKYSFILNSENAFIIFTYIIWMSKHSNVCICLYIQRFRLPSYYSL